MKYDLSYFEEQLEKYEITLTEKQKEQFITYFEMLIEKNKVMNLTAITEFDEVLEKHFLDSVSLTKVCDLNKNLSVIDNILLPAYKLTNDKAKRKKKYKSYFFHILPPKLIKFFKE